MTDFLLAAGNDQAQWMVFALGAIVIVYLVFRPMFRRKDPLEKGPDFSLASQRSVEREMSNLLVELSEMARQVTAQLDTRAAKLESLMQEADRKIAQLADLNQAPARTGSDAHQADAEVQAAATAVPIAPAPDPRYAQIYSLADQGSSAHEIARQLNRPRGEIELILALRMR